MALYDPSLKRIGRQTKLHILLAWKTLCKIFFKAESPTICRPYETKLCVRPWDVSNCKEGTKWFVNRFYWVWVNRSRNEHGFESQCETHVQTQKTKEYDANNGIWKWKWTLLWTWVIEKNTLIIVKLNMIHLNGTSRVSDNFNFSLKNSIFTANITPFFSWIIQKVTFLTRINNPAVFIRCERCAKCTWSVFNFTLNSSWLRTFLVHIGI